MAVVEEEKRLSHLDRFFDAAWELLPKRGWECPSKKSGFKSYIWHIAFKSHIWASQI